MACIFLFVGLKGLWLLEDQSEQESCHNKVTRFFRALKLSICLFYVSYRLCQCFTDSWYCQASIQPQLLFLQSNCACTRSSTSVCLWACVCVSPVCLASQPISWSARFEVDSLICPHAPVLKGILSSHTFSGDELNKRTALASMCHHRCSRYWWHIKPLDRAESPCNLISSWTGIKRNGWDWAATLMHSDHMIC